MSLCEEHSKLDEKLDHVIGIVNRIDHGLNGANGSIGLVKRVEKIERIIDKNALVWSRMRGLGSNLAIIIRTLLVAACMALGGYLFSLVV